MTRHDHAVRPRLGLCAGLLLLGLTGSAGCIEMDDSPSMQAELRSAKAELVEATRELKEVTAELKALRDEMQREERAVVGSSAASLSPGDRYTSAASTLKCSSNHRCTAPAKLLEEVLSDEAKLRKQARLRTVRDKGKITGFRIDQIKEGSLAELLGLQRADELKRVAGIKLDKMGVFKDVLAAVKGKSAVLVLFERSGRSINLRIDLE